MTELEAFEGYLLVVDGRAIRMPPPGMLTTAAPKRAPRAREGDTFFILVTPAENTRAPASFFEGLAQTGTDAYFGSGGGVTGGLREALFTIHDHLSTQGEHQPVNALALVLRGDELYAARSGRTFGVLTQGDDVTFFPTDRRDPLVIDLPPLGADADPDIQFAYYTIALGHTMLLSDAGLLDTDDKALGAALRGASLRAVIDDLKELAGEQATATVIQFLPPGAAGSADTMPQASAHATHVPTLQFTEQPAAPAKAAPAAAIEVDVLVDETVPEVAGVPFTEEQTEIAAEIVPILDAEAELPSEPQDLPTAEPGPKPAISTPPTRPQTPAAKPSTLPESDAAPTESAFQARMQQVRDNLSVTTDRLKDRVRSVDLSSLKKVTLSTRHTLRDGARAVLAGLLAVTDFLTRTLEQVLPEPKEGKQGIPANVAISTAILIPIVIIVVVVGLALSEQGKNDFEAYLNRAKQAHQDALEQSRAEEEPDALGETGFTCKDRSLRPTWEYVLRLADKAGEYRPKDKDVLRIRADALNFLDCYDKIDRRHLVKLREFPENADLVGPIVYGGIDLYTLDRANGQLYHDILNETGDGLLAQGDVPIWRGQAVGTYEVGDIFDIDWMRSGGTPHDNVLVGLDRSGLLVSYSPTFFASAQKLNIANYWVNPVAIAVYGENLYVLDAGANQVWRYAPPPGGYYTNVPEEYFSGEFRPDLGNAVDLGISDKGELYILFADGAVRKYFGSQQQRFEYAGTLGDIGLILSKDNAGQFVVTGTVPGSPAAEAIFLEDELADTPGFQAGDVIEAIDDTLLVGEWSLDDVADLLRGEKTTTVDVRGRRPSLNLPLTAPELKRSAEATITDGRALFVDNDPESYNLYIVSAQKQTVFETSWAGTYHRGYRPRENEDAFRDVSGIYAGSVQGNNMYVVADNVLYHFQRYETRRD